jgi:hypothetical protein
MPEHSVISDPDIHEPKGISTATIGEVYVADGLGGGTWKKPEFYLTHQITDASMALSTFILSPLAGTITKIALVVDQAFSADQTIDLEIGGVPVVGGAITLISAGSAAGDIYTSNVTAANTVTANQAIEIINSGGSAAAFEVSIVLTLQPS